MITVQSLEKTKKYILGVSGGPDSMALFAMCIENDIPVVVAHMNYQMRESAYRDMKLVEDYACMHQISCEIRYASTHEKGNFEAFAREQRYAFYHDLLQLYHADAILLAHHLDDHLETYLMQKQRNSEGVVWGIAEHSEVMGCNVVRPLLAYTKKDLLAYCSEHDVPFGIDETNDTDLYTRNQIRHSCIDPMSLEDKQRLNKQIENENIIKKQKQKEWEHFLLTWQKDLESLSIFDETSLLDFLFFYIKSETAYAISHAERRLIGKLIKGKRVGWSREIANAYDIYEEYGKLCIETKDELSYTYQYESIRFEKTPFFTIDKQGSSTQSVTLKEEDFPITIRNAKITDFIVLRYGKKKLNRWFIDRKIPKKERKRWPVVCNSVGNVILVPQIGCDIEHFSNNPTLFVLK